MAKRAGKVGKVGKDRGQGLSSLTCLSELPASCRRRSPSSKLLKAQIDDDADSWEGLKAQRDDGDDSWEVRAFAYDAVSKGPWPPIWYPCKFCFRRFLGAQALGGHMNSHKHERMSKKARRDEAAVAAKAAAAAAATAQELQASKNAAAVEILRPTALTNKDSDMATLLRLLGLPPLLGTAARFPLQSSSLPLTPRESNPVVPDHPQSLSATAQVFQPQSLSLRLSQMKSSKVVLGHLPSTVTTTEFLAPQTAEFLAPQTAEILAPQTVTTAELIPPQTFRFSVWPKRSAKAVPSPEFIASSSERACHSCQGQKPVALNRFPIMVGAPLDLELCLGRSFGN